MFTNKMPWGEKYGERFKCILMQKPSSREGLLKFSDQLQALGLLENITSFLSIGAGTGERELFLADQLKVPFGYLDPSSELTKMFSQNLNETKLDFLLQEKHFGPFETFKSSYHYDLIFAIHSWYYIGACESALRKALSLLSENGRLYIVMIPSRTFTVALSKEFGLCESDSNFLFSDGFSAWAKGKGYDHHYEEKESEFQVKDFFEGKEFTPYGKAWISYMLRQDWVNLSVQKREQLRDFFLNHQKNGIIREMIGSLVFRR